MNAPLDAKPQDALAALNEETERLVSITLDEASIGRAANEVEHERAIAIYDLVEENVFHPVMDPDEATGPYQLKLGLQDSRLSFEITYENGAPLATHILSLSPLRKIIRDYKLICDSYYAAIKTATPSQIEAIDMGRRGIHNDGSQTLIDRLNGKILMDFDTARRLFTLIFVLHWKG